MSGSGSGSNFDARALTEQETQAAGVFGGLARLTSRRVIELTYLNRLFREPALAEAAKFLAEAVGGPDMAIGPPEIIWRASGLRRTGAVAQVGWPRLSTRFAVGLETPLAHAVVDRLLGCRRTEAESHLQITPVEWGVLTLFFARSVERLVGQVGPVGPWDVWIDRVGPDAFDTSGLPRVVTLRWPVRLGDVAGAARVWLPGPLVDQWVARRPAVWPPTRPPSPRQAAFSATWRVRAGTLTLPRGIGALRPGALFPVARSDLSGTPSNPEGPVELRLDASGGGAWRWPALPKPGSGGKAVVLSAPWRFDPSKQEPTIVSEPRGPSDAAAADPPVTLVIELGRVNLPLTRLADLKPGDVIELQRHSREPIELTSGGRPVARGELVQVDADLGVRVTHVYL